MKKIITILAIVILLIVPNFVYAGGPSLIVGKFSNIEVEDDYFQFDFTGKIQFGILQDLERQHLKWEVNDFPIRITRWQSEDFNVQPKLTSYKEMTEAAIQYQKEGKGAVFLVGNVILHFDWGGKLIKVEGLWLNFTKIQR